MSADRKRALRESAQEWMQKRSRKVLDVRCSQRHLVGSVQATSNGLLVVGGQAEPDPTTGRWVSMARFDLIDGLGLDVISFSCMRCNRVEDASSDDLKVAALDSRRVDLQTHG